MIKTALALAIAALLTACSGMGSTAMSRSGATNTSAMGASGSMSMPAPMGVQIGNAQ